MIRNNPYGLKARLNVETMQVEFDIVDKKANDGKGSVIETKAFPASRVHQNLHKDVSLYGLSKLLQDRSSDIPTGPGKIAAMEEVMGLLEAGEWEKERKVGSPVVRPEVEALAQLKNCSVSDIQKSLKDYDKDAKERILSNPKVVELAAKIRASREATTVDLSDLEVAVA